MLSLSLPAPTAIPIGKSTKAFKLATPVLLATDDELLAFDEELLDFMELATDEKTELAMLELVIVELELRELETDEIEDAAPTIP